MDFLGRSTPLRPTLPSCMIWPGQIGRSFTLYSPPLQVYKVLRDVTRHRKCHGRNRERRGNGGNDDDPASGGGSGIAIVDNAANAEEEEDEDCASTSKRARMQPEPPSTSAESILASVGDVLAGLDPSGLDHAAAVFDLAIELVKKNNNKGLRNNNKN